MEEGELEKQRNTVMRSSNKRKPFANLTNIVRKPYPISPFSQSKRSASSTASDSSIGSSQNPIHEKNGLISPPNQVLPSTPPMLTPAHLLSDEKAYSHRKSTRKTSSKVKEISVPLFSSTMEKIKAIDESFSPHNMQNNTKNIMNTPLPQSTMKIKDKGKQIAVESSYPHLENTNINLPHSSMKIKDKGKSIALPPNSPPKKSKMVEFLAPSSGLNTKDKGKTAMNSRHVDLSQKDEGNAAITPIYHQTLKKDKRRSCPPPLRTPINRNQDVGVVDAFQSKLQTEPPPNKKKRYTSKESDEEYVLPQDFIDQQRAYFKEIDDFELEVEEV